MGKAIANNRRLSSFRVTSHALNAKTTSRSRAGAFASRFTELLADSVLALPRCRDRSSHSRSTRSPRMFVTKSDASRSSASTVDVQATSSGDVAKRGDPRASGRSVMTYHDVEGDGCCPANIKVRVRPRRSRRLLFPAARKGKRNSRSKSFAREERLLTPASHPPPPCSR